MKNLAIISLLIGVTSCSNSVWTKQEQSEFINACQSEGGTKSYCNCYMENVMQQYPIKEDASNIDYETKIELSKACN